MFSAEYFKEIRTAFDRQMKLLEERICGVKGNEKQKEIYDTMNSCTEEESQALSFLYSAMPFSDLLDYPANLFLTYARHGVFLWNQGPFAGKVPEKLFANYVLFHRVNNEDITETRKFFYEKLNETTKVRTDSLYYGAVDVNYWCAGEATYRASDDRTQNPRTMYYAATGRCGEESTFTVTALRSLGIPARQVYAPLWSHCDDNHAWVEVWCEDNWHFLGACEPEIRLDQGWFTGPSSRAMMVHSRWFDKSEPEEEQVGRKGAVKVLNHLARYACTVRLSVKTVDEKGRPLPGVKVEFQVLNQGTFGTIAVVYTGSEPETYGVAELTTGLGSLHISASTRIASMASVTGEEWLYGETEADLRYIEEAKSRCTRSQNVKSEYVIVMHPYPECFEGWQEFDFYAPELCQRSENFLQEKEEAEEASDVEQGKLRLEEMTKHREKKEKGFYQEERAEQILESFEGQDRIQVEDILHKARGNMDELVRFLEWDATEYLPADREESGPEGNTKDYINDNKKGWKLKFLNTLREKDYRDIKTDILEDCCRNGLTYAGQVPEDIFFPYVMCPRVSNEMLTSCREKLCQCLEASEKELIRKSPECLWKMIEERIKSLPEQEYEDLITSPFNCLKAGIGSRHSKEVLCVSLYRSLGIPARLNPFDGRVEYYVDGKFVPAENITERRQKISEKEIKFCPEAKSCNLTLCEDSSLKLSDWAFYSLERYEEGSFRRLWPHQELRHRKDGCLDLRLYPGIYRIIVTDRLKNGDQLARKTVFELESGKNRSVILSQRKVQKEERKSGIRVEEFTLRTLSGEDQKVSSLLDSKSHRNTLFLWLEAGREPTEHILNELYEKRETFFKLNNRIYLILNKPEDLENATLHRTLAALPKLCVVLDLLEENIKILADQIGEESGKLPLALVLNSEQECLYSSAGYNVGLADALLKYCNTL